MRVRAATILAGVLFSAFGVAPSRASVTVTREPISFRVVNPVEPAKTYTINGTLVRPAGCTDNVLLALHGLSYGQWAWDFPIRPETYSVAQALAQRGYATVAIDQLGYGASAGEGSPDHPNGYTLTVEGYADMALQIMDELAETFDHVGVIGHSAGSEIAELAVGLADAGRGTSHADPEILVATAYTHEPYVNNDWLQREWFQDNQRALMDDYEYFETDPETRAKDMYNLDLADTDVVAEDTARANLTPSGEIFSINPQPSRAVLAQITTPTLLLLAEKDTLFPASLGEGELSLWTGATDVTLNVVPQAGHVFMLQRNAPVANAMIGDWLQAHPSFTRC